MVKRSKRPKPLSKGSKENGFGAPFHTGEVVERRDYTRTSIWVRIFDGRFAHRADLTRWVCYGHGTRIIFARLIPDRARNVVFGPTNGYYKPTTQAFHPQGLIHYTRLKLLMPTRSHGPFQSLRGSCHSQIKTGPSFPGMTYVFQSTSLVMLPRGLLRAQDS